MRSTRNKRKVLDDSRLDIVVVNPGTFSVNIFFGHVSERFLSAPAYSTGFSSRPTSIAVGDFDKDTRLDIVVANNGSNNMLLLSGTGYGTFISQITYSTGNGTGTFSRQMIYFTGFGSQPYSVAVVDFNSDTRLDIAVANYGTNSVGVFLGYGNGSFASQLIFLAGFGSHPFALVVGDINKDTLTDIAVTNNGYGNIDIILKIC